MSVKRKSLCSEAEPSDKSVYQRSSKPAKKRRTEEYAETLGVEQKVGTKVKRQVWTPTSIDAFFEGLSQHGKSFHGILHYMQAKFKKKNDPTIPNLTKDQVRFFYYRTWHKVSIMLGECSTDESSRKQLKLGCEELSPPPVNRKFSEQEDVDNPLDSSAEEGDGGELSPRGASSPAAPPDQNSSPSRLQSNSASCLEPNISEKGKESAPNSTSVTFADDKMDLKKEMAKDTVVVNGKSHSVDLVALICYHKLRKKCPEQVIGRKLREMVNQGYTTIREKGKRKLQVKIPNCRALRGTLHSIDIPPPADGAYSEPEPLTPSEETRHVVVELRPLSVTSWLYVQGLAQNPRVRLIVAASKPVSEIVQYLALKWHFKPSKAEDKINFYHTYSVESAAASSVSLTRQRLPNESNTVQEEGKGSAAANEPDVQKDVVVRLDLIPPPGPVLGLTHSECHDLIVSGSTQMPPHSAASCENVSSLMNAKDATYRLLDPLSECTVEDLHQKFLKPMKLQLFYDFPNREYTCAAETTCNLKLATLCRMVEFIGHYEETRIVTSLAAPVSAVGSVQSSPKRIGYVKLAPKRSPWKSPLSKYQRMKSGSPLKQMSVRRTRLNFSLAPSTYTGGGSLQAMSSQEQAAPLTPTMPTSYSPRHTPEPQKAGLPAASSGTSAEGFSSIKLGNPVLQDAVKKSGTSVGSFMSLDCIVPQSSFTQEPLETERSPATTSQGPESPEMTRPTITTPSYHISLTGQSRVIVSPLTLSSPRGPPVDAGRGSPKGPSVLVQPLNRFTEAAVSQSPLLQFATNSLGTSFSEKNIANVTTINSQQLPIVTQLKPFSKAKRVKKAPGKAVQTRQLVPRPLSFLSNPPLANVQTPKPIAVTDPVPPVNPLQISQPSNPVHMSNLNNPSVSHQVLSLLQSLLQQQMHNNASSSNRLLQLELSKQQPPAADHVSGDPVAPAALQENTCRDLEAGTVEKSPLHTANTSDSAEVLNTSSDTVNELLRGLCSHPSDNSLQRLSEETADVLPSFAKAMLSLESTPPSAPSLSEDTILNGLMDQGELMELAGVFSQLKEALQTPEKARQQNPDAEVSISELLNLSDSERKSEHPLLSSGDSTFRSLLDDSSVDYIQKFREIASRMNQSS